MSGGSVGKKSTKRKGKSKRAGRKKTPTTFSVQLAATTTTGCILSANALGQRIGSERDLTMGAIHDLEALIASGSCVDEHTQDQLIVFMALAQGGKSTLRCSTPKLSQHADTAIHFAELLSGAKFDVTDGDEGVRIITCTAT